MVQETIECAASKTTLPIPVIPSLAENIPNVQKETKQERNNSETNFQVSVIGNMFFLSL